MTTVICTSCGKIWNTQNPAKHPQCPACNAPLVTKPSTHIPTAIPLNANTQPAPAGWSHAWTAVLIALAFLIVGGIAIAAIIASSKGTLPPNPTAEVPPKAIPNQSVTATTQLASPAQTQPANPLADLQGRTGHDVQGNPWYVDPESNTWKPGLHPALRGAATTQPTAPKPALTPTELFAAASPAVAWVEIRDKDLKPLKFGSGFFVSEDGLLVTNFHVIKGAAFASVILSNGTTFFVDGIASNDETHDLALLKVNGKKLPFLIVADAPPPPVGTKVYAIGNPEGQANTFSEGMVSALREEGGKLVDIQTTAPISHGSSGGPLLIADGRVVGVTSSGIEAGQNLNFAVPGAQVIQLVKNRGKLAALASAGGKSLDKEDSAELDKVWEAIDQKNWRLALSILEKLRPESGNNPSYWFVTGYLQDELGNYDLAVDAYKRCLKLQPDSYVAYVNMGVAYSYQGKYTEAIAACKSALAINPNCALAYDNLGNDFVDQRKYAEAIAAYQSAIVIDPSDARTYSDLGIAYDHQGKFVEAIATYKSAIVIDPNDTHAYTNLGTAYVHQDNYAAAIAAYKSAIAIDPNYAGAYYGMGVAYSLQRNKVEAAVAAYHKAIELDPNGRIGSMAREALQKITQ